MVIIIYSIVMKVVWYVGKNPYDGYVPEVPDGERMDFGSDSFIEYERQGILNSNMRLCASGKTDECNAAVGKQLCKFLTHVVNELSTASQAASGHLYDLDGARWRRLFFFNSFVQQLSCN